MGRNVGARRRTTVTQDTMRHPAMNECGPLPYVYSIYGLALASDLALPELTPIDRVGDPDLVLRAGDVPPVWEETDPTKLRSFLDGGPQHMWMRIPGTVRMSVRDGFDIAYALEPGGMEDAARLFLLGSGLGAALMQRGYVVIHGNAISLPDRDDAIVCIGDSGVGKSTTAIAMMQRGFAILADDVCPIGPDGRIEPGMPRAKLWQETAAQLSISTDGLAQIREGDAKFNLPLAESHCREARAIHSFVWLVPADVDAVQCSEVTGVEKFTVLRNNLYRPEFLQLFDLEVEHLGQIARIAEGSRVFKVMRPRSGFDIDPLLDAISLLYNGGEPVSPAALQP